MKNIFQRNQDKEIDLHKHFLCVNEYLDAEECSEYINFYEKNKNDVFTYYSSSPLKIYGDSVTEKIRHDFNIDAPADNVEIIKREQKSYMDNHYDEGDSLAYILYLNDDFKGGETVFENNTIIAPKVGRLLLFTNGILLHKVNEITDGVRYVLAGWFK